MAGLVFGITARGAAPSTVHQVWRKLATALEQRVARVLHGTFGKAR
jgi:hypothetical protein